MDLRSKGLEIDVLDHYTGRVRSVKSLSGDPLRRPYLWLWGCRM